MEWEYPVLAMFQVRFCLPPWNSVSSVHAHAVWNLPKTTGPVFRSAARGLRTSSDLWGVRNRHDDILLSTRQFSFQRAIPLSRSGFHVFIRQALQPFICHSCTLLYDVQPCKSSCFRSFSKRKIINIRAVSPCVPISRSIYQIIRGGKSRPSGPQ